MVTGVIAVVIALGLAACGGGGGGGGADGAASAPLTAGIDASMGRNPANVINASTASMVEVAVEVGSDALASDVVTVTLTDGMAEASASAPSIEGGGTVIVGPIDASSLADGPIEAIVTITRAGGARVSVSFGTLFFKDTQQPSTALAVSVPSGAGNPADVVNASTASSLSVAVAFDATASASDLVSVIISDGITMIESAAQNVAPSSTVTLTGIDISSLQDGPLDLMAQVMDASENVTTTAGVATLDTQLPAIVSARVNQGAGNAFSVINESSVAGVSIDVVFDSTAADTDSMSVNLTDSLGNVVSSGPIAAIAGGGTATVSGLDASALMDGSVALDVIVTDPNGNSATSAGSPANLDTTVADIAAASIAAGAGNATGIINQSSASTVSINVDFSDAVMDGDQIQVTLTDDFGLAISSSMVPLTAGLLSTTVSGFDCSGMSDGSVSIAVTLQDTQANLRSAQGTAGIVDLTAPTGHNSAYVAAAPGSAQHVINIANAGSVTVEADLMTEADASRMATLVLTSGTNSITVGPMTVPTAAGIFAFSGIDTSSLADGTVSISITYQDPNGNSAAQAGTAATRDTFLATPSASFIAASGANAANVVNSFTVSNATAQVDLPSGTLASDSFRLSISDGSFSFDSATQPGIAGGGSLTFSGLNLSGLQDGPLAITVIGGDSAGNANATAGTTATKDATAPEGAASARVLAGPNNADHEINSANESLTRVSVRFGPNASSADQYRVLLSGTGQTVTSADAAVPGPDGLAQVTLDTSGLPDGPVTVRVRTFDAAGNFIVTIGSSATKSTQAVQAVSAQIPATMANPANYVNAATASSATVDVVMPAETTGTESVYVQLVGNSVAAISPSSIAPAGGGMMQFFVDASGLVDGSIAVAVFVMEPSGDMSNFAGTSAVKDTVAPSGAVQVVIPQTAGGPEGFVNATTQSSARFNAVFPGGYQGTELATLTVTDGVTSVTSSAQGLVPSSGTLAFTGLNLSSLADGVLTAMVDVADVAGNIQTNSFTPGQKDTVAPQRLVSAFVQLGANNAIDVINSFSAAATILGIESDPQATVDDAVNLVLSGSGPPVSFPELRINTPGLRQTTSAVDVSGLADGTLTISGTIRDAAGNTRTIRPRMVLKDTAPPAVATSAFAQAGGSNPQDFVNSASQAAAMIQVGFGASSAPSDVARITVTGTSGSVSSTAQNAVPSGAVTFGPLDLSGLPDGALTITVTTTDAQGNQATFAGAATKDTIAPANPSALAVPAGPSNSAGFVTNATQTSATVGVTFDSSATGNETAMVILGSATSVSMTVPMGGGSVSFTGLDVSADGEGALGLSVVIDEPSGNQTIFAGTAPTKDTVAPTAPTAAMIPASASNPADIVNTQNEGSVAIDVSWNGSADASDAATVTLSDGVTTATTTIQNASPSATVTYMVDASGLSDGAISITVDVLDLAGNPTAFGGNASSKDTVLPTVPTAAQVAAGGMNPADFINTANDTSVMIDVTWPGATLGTETAIVTLSDGAASAQSASLTAPGGGGSQTYMVDASSLAEGPISVQVDVTGATLNQDSFAGTAATRDVTLPAPPGSAEVTAGAGNATNVINLSNLATANVDVTWTASAATTDTAIVTLSDGVTNVVSMAQNAAPSATVSYSLDATTLADGMITVTISATDQAQNQALFVVTTATKDATAPLAPTSANVAAGGGNAIDVINLSNEATVMVDAAWPGGADGADQFTVTLSDGVAMATATGTVSPGATTMTMLDASGLADGAISVSIDIVDAAGNPTNFMGTMATKDATAPELAGSVIVAANGAFGNPQGFVNTASQGSVDVDLSWSGTADALDMATVSISDGATTTAGVTLAVNPGATVTYNFDASALVDGPLTLFVSTSDAAGNLTLQTGNATQDTVAPAAPSSQGIAMVASTIPTDVINLANVATTSIGVVFGAGTTATDAAVGTLTDGVVSLDTASLALTAGGGSFAYASLDTSSLAEGAIMLTTTVTDSAGNVTTFGPTALTKDTVAPTSFSAAHVRNSGSNPIDVINNLNETAVQVDVDFDGTSLAADTVTVEISDGISTVTIGTGFGTVGAATGTFGTGNASALAEGMIGVQVTISDANFNSASFAGTTALKDATPPDAPTAAGIALTGNNPVNFINILSEAAVVVSVTVPAAYDGTESVSASLTDGVSTVNTATMTAPTGGGIITFAAVDTSTLTEGAITVTGQAMDVNQNIRLFTGTAGTKDTTAPPAATASTVAAVMSVNPTDIINGNNQAALSVSVTYDAATVGDETTFIELTGGASVTYASQTAPAGAGPLSFGPMDVSALTDGAVSVDTTITDPAGNPTTASFAVLTKDTVAPAAPTAANVNDDGSNPMDVVNSANEGAVNVDVTFAASSVAGDTVTVELTDGVATITVGTGNGTAGAGTATFGAGDATALAEGSLSLSVTLTDANLNAATYAGTAASKDVTAPAAPTAGIIAMTVNNPQGFINAASQAAVQVDVTVPASYDGTESLSVTLGDGAATASSGSMAAPNGGGTLSFSVNATALAEGAITVSVDYMDAVQNQATFAGTAGTKDVTAPPAPTAATVPMVMSVNPVDTINGLNVTAVPVSVTFDGATVGDETAFVTFTDGVVSIDSASITAPAGGMASLGTTSTTTLADGSVMLSVTITDPAGNSTPFGPVALTKDTVAPAAVTLLQIPAGVDNPISTVNSTTVTSANFAVNFPASAMNTDTVTITLSDGVTTFTLTRNPPNGGGLRIYPGHNLSALTDGQLDLRATVSDPSGNGTSFTGQTVTKDTTLANATAAMVAMGPSNGANVINGFNEASVQVDVTFPGTVDGSESFTVTLFDGATSVVSSSAAVIAGGGSQIVSLDSTSLAEGVISITIAISDAARNMNTLVGTSATKDITAPTAPTSGNVAAGGSNGTDQINLSNEGAVSVDLVWPPSASAADSFIVTLTDGAASFASASMNPPGGGGTQTVNGLDASGLADGSISIAVDVTDANGNTIVFGGTPAAKDTTVVGTSGITVAATASNAFQTISAATASSFDVSVGFDTSADGTESATLRVTDGAAMVTSSAFAIPSGGATHVFSGLDATGLADGTVTAFVDVTDNAGNLVTTFGTVTLDTVVPSLPTVAKVAATPDNMENFISAASIGMVSVELTFPGTSNADDMAVVTISDGAAMATSAAMAAPGGGGTITVTGINCSAFAEGAVTLSVAMSDQALNVAGPFAGTGATVDVTAPAVPTVDPVTSPWNAASQNLTGVGPFSHDIVVDGGAAQAVATADAFGIFTVSITLTAGVTNSLTVYSRDAAGNLSNPVTTAFNAAALDIHQDATAPDVPFSDQTTAFALGNAGAVDGGAFADFDNDGDLDLWLASGAAGSLYEYDATSGSFTDITLSAGGPFIGDTAAIWGDYDNDGDQDVLTVDSTAGTTLYRNNFIGLGTRTFTDVTIAESAGVASTSLSQAFWFDYDNDGFLDFLALDGTLNNNFLMVNQRSGSTSFARVTMSGLDASITASMLGAVADFDADGDIDVIFGDDSPGVFYRNDGGGSFTDIAGVTSGVTFDHSAGGRGIAFADYDNDGDFDLFILRGGAANVNQLWRNDGATFTEVAALAGLDTDVDGDDVAWADFNNDGLLDLYVGSNGANKIYLGVGDTNTDNVFEFVAAFGASVDDAGNADMVQLADLDDDGDIEVFVGNEGSANILFRNDLNNFNFLKVRVRGLGMGAGTSPRDGRGAIVRLRSEGGTLLATREINGGRGKGSQDCHEVHFGGVVPSRKYQVEVQFTSGTTRTSIVTPRTLSGQTVTVNE